MLSSTKLIFSINLVTSIFRRDFTQSLVPKLRLFDHDMSIVSPIGGPLRHPLLIERNAIQMYQSKATIHHLHYES